MLHLRYMLNILELKRHVSPPDKFINTVIVFKQRSQMRSSRECVSDDKNFGLIPESISVPDWRSQLISSFWLKHIRIKCDLGDFPGRPVVRLRLLAQGAGSIPGQGGKIPHTLQFKNQNIKQTQHFNKFNKNFKDDPH